MIDVVIIGAGISGLACAKVLSSFPDDINLIVLEASNRIGGRIKTIKADDGTVLDVGAQFIHGTEGNPLYDFAVERGLLKTDEHALHAMFSSNEGKCFPRDILSAYSEEELEEAFQTTSSYVEDFVRKMYMLNKEDLDGFPHKTVGEFMLSMFSVTAAEIASDQNLLNMFKSVFMQWAYIENIASGCKSVFDLDLRGFLSYVELEGDSLLEMCTLCVGGYEAVVDELVKDVDTDCIRFDCEVDEIDNVCVDGVSKIEISCNNGNKFHADTAILTVSVGVLKHFVKNSTFLLDLPKKKLLSIEKLHLSNVVKIFFKFLTPIPDDVFFFTFFQQPESFDSGTFHCDCPCLERIGKSDWWLLWVICDDVEFKTDNTGDYVNNLLELCSSVYSNFPRNEVDRNNIITTDWKTDKYYRGAYTYLKAGTDENDIATLAEPLSYGQASLLFAGEASSKEFFSTTHGAYLTGLREAENVITKYNISPVDRKLQSITR